MSHFIVVVSGENYEETLAPFDEGSAAFSTFHPITEADWEVFKNEKPDHAQKYKDYKNWVTSWHGAEYCRKNKAYGFYRNENAQWDWYVLGGRWPDYFALKKDSISPYPNRKDDNDPTRFYADMARVRDIDFDLIREDSRKSANLSYDALEKALNGRKLVSWKKTLDEFEGDVERARTAFAEMPVNIALSQAKIFCFEDPVDVFKESREEYVASQVISAGVPYAFAHAGCWYGRGSMGWFGFSDDKMTKEEWAKQYWAWIDSLDPETALCAVDCHI